METKKTVICQVDKGVDDKSDHILQIIDAFLEDRYDDVLPRNIHLVN